MVSHRKKLKNKSRNFSTFPTVLPSVAQITTSGFIKLFVPEVRSRRIEINFSHLPRLVILPKAFT